jgi:hypothetical protein
LPALQAYDDARLALVIAQRGIARIVIVVAMSTFVALAIASFAL